MEPRFRTAAESAVHACAKICRSFSPSPLRPLRTDAH
nr:MAG TPA: hypothetical protein [Caudoviricetes sp.]